MSEALNQCQSDLLEKIDEHYECKKKLHVIIQSISQHGKELVDELRKIPGWECMIQNCRSHYEQYPDEFFNWCSYEVEEHYDRKYKDHLLVMKYYAYGDPEGYIVLDIDLATPLEEQVKRKQNKIQQERESDLRKKYEKDMELFDALDAERISFEEWAERKKTK